MTAWRRRFQLKDLLITDRDVNPEEASDIGHVVAQRLREHMPFYAGFSEMLARKFSKISDEDSFNRVLDELYDVADHQKIWVY